jgi:hypothetical protein
MIDVAAPSVAIGSQRHRHTFGQTACTVLHLHGQVLSATGTLGALVGIRS